MFDFSPSGLLHFAARRADLAETFNQGASAHEEARRAYNLAAQLPHPDFDSVRRTLESSARLNAVHPGRRRLVGIDGDFKSGKTDLITRFVMEFSESVWATRGTEVVQDGLRNQVIPAFIGNASASGEADLMRSLSQAVGLPSPPKSDTAVQMLSRVAGQCRRSGTMYGFIDDANMLATSRRQENLTQFIKRMANELPVTLVFVGKGLQQSPVLQAVTHFKADTDAASQVSRRMSRIAVTTLPGDSDGIPRFVAAVREAAKAFLFAEPDPLRDLAPEHFAWLHGVTGGRLGDLFEMLTHAAHDAVGVQERITPKLLRRAHRLLHSTLE